MATSPEGGDDDDTATGVTHNSYITLPVASESHTDMPSTLDTPGTDMEIATAASDALVTVTDAEDCCTHTNASGNLLYEIIFVLSVI